MARGTQLLELVAQLEAAIEQPQVGGDQDQINH